MRFSNLATPLGLEIQQEIAASYFAECKKMVESLKSLNDFDQAYPREHLTSEQAAQRTELLAKAGERVHFVLVQREALQLSGGEAFFRDYKISEEVRSCLKPQPPK